MKAKTHYKKRDVAAHAPLWPKKNRLHPFAAVKPFVAFLLLLAFVLFLLRYFFHIQISTLAVALLVAFVVLIATAILYAYDLHAREPAEEEDWDRLMKEDLHGTKDLMRQSNQNVFQYLK